MRLVSWPLGIRPQSAEPKAGPRSIGASSTETQTGFVQTVASPFGAWVWVFSLPPLRGEAFRRWRGFVVAQHAGSNAARVTIDDPDRWSAREMGVAAPRDLVPFADGIVFADGVTFAAGVPAETVDVTAGAGETVVSIAGSIWADRLDLGDRFGISGQFGLYQVTGRRADGRVTIWPPLRAEARAGALALLRPVLAMRLVSAELPPLGRGVSHADGLTITLAEDVDANITGWDAP